jgi:hypothetical protein
MSDLSKPLRTHPGKNKKDGVWAANAVGIAAAVSIRAAPVKTAVRRARDMDDP